MTDDHHITLTVEGERSLKALRELLRRKGIFTCEKPLKWRWKHLSWKEKYEAKQKIKLQLYGKD